MTTNISNLKVFYFYPRSPCGERRSFFKRLFGIHEEFLSTLSLRRATESSGRIGLFCHISIHALLAESDGGVLLSFFGRIIFLSTLSLRRATTLR